MGTSAADIEPVTEPPLAPIGGEPVTPPVTPEPVTLKAGAFKDRGVMSKAADAMLSLIGRAVKRPEDGFMVTKQADGRMRWFSRYSNSWEDRDGEIITEEAHKDYVAWANENQAYPELWLWHTKGTRFGEADWLDYTDGFAHASGLIDVGKEHIVTSLANKELGVSHGFFSAQEGKYITRYRSFEVSVLPRERAAVWTADFNILTKETELMAFTPERRAFLVEQLGEETVKGLEGNTTQVASQLKELGIAFKEADAAEVEQKVEGETAKALAPILVDLQEGMKALAGAMVTLRKEVDTKTKPVQEQVAQMTEDQFLGKLKEVMASGGITRPTESDKNVTDEKTKAASDPDDFFNQQVGKAFNLDALAGAAAPQGAGTPAAGAVSIS